MIPMFKVRMSKEALKNVGRVFESGMIGEGPEVAKFTHKLEEYFECKNVIPLNSGTSSLTLALRLAGVGGGEVITTPFTMIATNVTIKATGAEPIFADIEEDNVNISIESIRSKITSRTRAIILTHVAGIPCRMDKALTLGLPIISDAAHAIGTYYQGVHISHWADYSCFSFQSIKHLTTGDGGAIIVKDDAKYRLAEKLKWFGMTRVIPKGKTRLQHQMTTDVEEWGYKFHMNDISAAIGLANLKDLNSTITRHWHNALYYRSELHDIDGLSLPTIPFGSEPSWFAFPLFVERRDDFIQMMIEKGIETTPMWRRNDEYTTFKREGTPLPNMTKLQDKIVFIPVGWWLSWEDREYIVNTIKGGW